MAGRRQSTAATHIVSWPTVAGLCVCVFLSVRATPGRTETLYDAFDQAYASNPVLGAQRVAVRISAQDKEIAKTGFAPALTASSDYGYRDQKGRAPGNPTSELVSHPRGYGATLSQNLWNGFKTSNSVARENASLAAAREDLRNTEQTVLVDVATAYADVLRDRAILDLRRADVELFGSRAQQTRFQLQIGAMTRTDVDQSDASLARSQADLAVATTNLDASCAAYRSIVGREPGRLAPAAVPQKLLPPDLGAALVVAQSDHPAVRAAMDAVRAAEFNVDVEKGGYAPSLDLTASADRRWDPDYYPARTDLNEVSVVGRLSFPIYDRGLTSASVHRATEVTSQRLLQLDNQRVQVRASLVQAWGLYAAAKTVIGSADAQIAASDRALYGMQLEATAGQRTTIDVLTAQRALTEARVNREVAQHDRIIAGYKLLASVGRLSLALMTQADTRGPDAGPARRARPRPPPAVPALLAELPLRPGL